MRGQARLPFRAAPGHTPSPALTMKRCIESMPPVVRDIAQAALTALIHAEHETAIRRATEACLSLFDEHGAPDALRAAFVAEVATWK